MKVKKYFVSFGGFGEGFGVLEQRFLSPTPQLNFDMQGPFQSR